MIGGGVIGLFSAYYLAKDGHQVTVIERGQPDEETTSHGNAGMIVPSHFTPLASPGMLRLGLRMMLRPDGPLAIHKPWSPETLRWVWAFLRSANRRHVAHSEALIRDLNLDSKKAYIEFAKDHEIALTTSGLLMLCRTEHALEEEAQTISRATELGLKTSLLNSADLAKLEPDTTINAAGAVYFEDDAFVSPVRVLAALNRSLGDMRVERRFGCEVTGATSNGRNITGLQTNQGVIETDQVVLAAGAWSARVGRRIGASLNILPGKGYGFWATQGPVSLRHCAILVEARVAVTPMPEGLRCTGVMEIGSFDKSINPRRLQAVREGVGHYLPQFAEAAKQANPVWVGHRPLSPTGVPYLGNAAEFDNLTLATGHGMMGLSLAARRDPTTS